MRTIEELQHQRGILDSSVHRSYVETLIDELIDEKKNLKNKTEVLDRTALRNMELKGQLAACHEDNARVISELEKDLTVMTQSRDRAENSLKVRTDTLDFVCQEKEAIQGFYDMNLKDFKRVSDEIVRITGERDKCSDAINTHIEMEASLRKQLCELRNEMISLQKCYEMNLKDFRRVNDENKELRNTLNLVTENRDRVHQELLAEIKAKNNLQVSFNMARENQAAWLNLSAELASDTLFGDNPVPTKQTLVQHFIKTACEWREEIAALQDEVKHAGGLARANWRSKLESAEARIKALEAQATTKKELDVLNEYYRGFDLGAGSKEAQIKTLEAQVNSNQEVIDMLIAKSDGLEKQYKTDTNRIEYLEQELSSTERTLAELVRKQSSMKGIQHAMDTITDLDKALQIQKSMVEDLRQSLDIAMSDMNKLILAGNDLLTYGRFRGSIRGEKAADKFRQIRENIGEAPGTEYKPWPGLLEPCSKCRNYGGAGTCVAGASTSYAQQLDECAKFQPSEVYVPKGDWHFERSSGYAGYRCSNCDTWIYDRQFVNINTRRCDCDKK